MMTSSNGNFFRVTGDLWIPLTKASERSFDVFFDLRLNKRLKTFETLVSWDAIALI